MPEKGFDWHCFIICAMGIATVILIMAKSTTL